jgi:hypothetical protein
MWASKMLHHSYDIFVHNLKKLFDYFLTSFHCTTGKLNSPASPGIPLTPGACASLLANRQVAGAPMLLFLGSKLFDWRFFTRDQQ